MPHRIALPVLLAALILVGCGDHKKRSAGDVADRRAGAEDTQRATPHIGRDAKPVLSAFGDGQDGAGDRREVLEQADTVTLYTVNPTRVVDGKLSPEAERFRGYGILGTSEITDPAERRRLVEAVYEGLEAEGAGPASCFLPRHALRFRKGGRTIDALICFQCTWIYLYEDDIEHEKRMLFGAGVKPVFDSLVKARNLPVDGS